MELPVEIPVFLPLQRLSRQSFFLEFWFLDISFQDLSYFCQVESHEWHFFSSKNPPHPSPHKKKNKKLHDFVKVRLLLTWSIWTVAPVAGSYDGVALDEWPYPLRCFFRCELVIPGSLGWKPMVTVFQVLWEGTLESSLQIHWGALFFFPHHRFLCWLGSCWKKGARLFTNGCWLVLDAQVMRFLEWWKWNAKSINRADPDKQKQRNLEPCRGFCSCSRCILPSGNLTKQFKVQHLYIYLIYFPPLHKKGTPIFSFKKNRANRALLVCVGCTSEIPPSTVTFSDIRYPQPCRVQVSTSHNPVKDGLMAGDLTHQYGTKCMAGASGIGLHCYIFVKTEV